MSDRAQRWIIILLLLAIGAGGWFAYGEYKSDRAQDSWNDKIRVVPN